jgi:hypothetical protein
MSGSRAASGPVKHDMDAEAGDCLVCGRPCGGMTATDDLELTQEFTTVDRLNAMDPHRGLGFLMALGATLSIGLVTRR